MSRQNNSFLHIGFEEYTYLGSLIGIFNNEQENNESEKSLLLTDSGLVKSGLRSYTLLDRINHQEEI